jgi:hypothetical protein
MLDPPVYSNPKEPPSQLSVNSHWWKSISAANETPVIGPLMRREMCELDR